MARKADGGMFVPEAEQPYKIPHNWHWTTLGAINRYCPHTIDPANQPDTYFELYSVPSVEINYPEIIPGSEIGSTKQAVQKNDVLLCKINPRINRVWKVSKHTNYQLLASSEWIVIRNSQMNQNFMFHYLRSPLFREFMLSHVVGVGGSLMRAQPKYVKQYPIPVPPLAEQQRIVERIESLFAKLDAARDKAQAVVDGFELRKAAILYRAFNGELTEQWRENSGLSLNSWLQLDFDSCVEKMQNGLVKRKGTTGNPVVVLRLANLSDDGFLTDDLREIVLDEKERETYSLNPGDALMIRVNGSKENVGKQFLISNQNTWAFCDHIIRIKYQRKVRPEYMIFFSKSEMYRQYVRSHIVSSAGQNTISRRGMSGLAVPVPTIKEQDEIIRLLDEALEKEREVRDKAQQVIDNIDAMKKAILGRAFRGELGTNDPSEASPEHTIIGG